MAIRNRNDGDESSMCSLLPIVRSPLRTVDRIGYVNASTLLVCMPSVGEEVAIERGTLKFVIRRLRWGWQRVATASGQ